MKSTLAAVAFSMALTAPPSSTAARLAGGAPPGLAPMAVGGGQVIVELSIGATGSVDKVRTVRSTPPFTDMIVSAVSGWRFTPATDTAIGKDGKPQAPRNVASKVLVAAVYRAPVLQGPSQGEMPVNVAAPSADLAFPSSLPEPVFPAVAQNGGVVMIEALLSASGAITVARVISSAPPFDQAALDAARQWRFRPPRVGGSTESYAYLIFGFPQPVTAK
jgi:TonB family protein